MSGNGGDVIWDELKHDGTKKGRSYAELAGTGPEVCSCRKAARKEFGQRRPLNQGSRQQTRCLCS